MASSTTMLIEYDDGSKGCVLGGMFKKMYGPPKKSKDVTSVQITRGDAETRSCQKRGVGFEITRARGRADMLPNLLFSCDWLEDRDGPVFVQHPWPLVDDGIIVRALHPGALRGDGAMVRSGQGTMYVMDATLPTDARKGYLAVQGPEKVELFLNTFHWESRSEGYMGANTDKGERVRSFVVKDLFAHRRGTGYYVLPRYSDVDRSRLVCHLEPIGALRDLVQRHDLIPCKARSCCTSGPAPGSLMHAVSCSTEESINQATLRVWRKRAIRAVLKAVSKAKTAQFRQPGRLRTLTSATKILRIYVGFTIARRHCDRRKLFREHESRCGLGQKGGCWYQQANDRCPPPFVLDSIQTEQACKG